MDRRDVEPFVTGPIDRFLDGPLGASPADNQEIAFLVHGFEEVGYI